ncbi:MAG: hypothetical protein VX738_02460 [Planctomycetota bacterium]|nr:hypothetical protein [Planctomycetota bacterium]
MRYWLILVVTLVSFIPSLQASRKVRPGTVIDELSAARAATHTASWAQPDATRTRILSYVPGPIIQGDKNDPVMGTFGVDDPGRQRRRPIARKLPWREGLDGAGSYKTDGPPLLFFRPSRHSVHDGPAAPTSGH